MLNSRVPPRTVVTPVKVLAEGPVNASVPLPTFVTESSLVLSRHKAYGNLGVYLTFFREITQVCDRAAGP